jgi:hypothetical protein
LHDALKKSRGETRERDLESAAHAANMATWRIRSTVHWTSANMSRRVLIRRVQKAKARMESWRRTPIESNARRGFLGGCSGFPANTNESGRRWQPVAVPCVLAYPPEKDERYQNAKLRVPHIWLFRSVQNHFTEQVVHHVAKQG